MTRTLKTIIGVVALTAATHASAEITVYQGERFRGRAVTSSNQLRDLQGTPFGTRARSIVVYRGNWEVCDRPGFGGNCVLLQAGSYDSVDQMGLDHGIASARGVKRHSQYRVVPPPLALPTYEYRQRPRERIYEARVLAVRAVVGPPEQRCWVEREQVVEREAPSGKGALAGAIIGGILGHQIGDNDAGTVGGAVAGAAIGANVGRGSSVYEQDVQRCANLPPGPPDYWDVTYEFRGYRHRVQMSEPPGPTVTVNGEGEPRG